MKITSIEFDWKEDTICDVSSVTLDDGTILEDKESLNIIKSYINAMTNLIESLNLGLEL